MKNDSNFVKIREFDRLKFQDPEKVLIELRKIEHVLANASVDKKIRELRTNKLKIHREGREAAIFCYGLSKVLGEKVYFSLDESEDHDFVSMWKNNDVLVYTPVQLKEVVPDSMNIKCTIESVLSKLAKYSGDDLVVAVHLNKQSRFDFTKIKIPKLKISQLWMFGSLSLDQNKWFIYGDMLGHSNFYEFFYPVL